MFTLFLDKTISLLEPLLQTIEIMQNNLTNYCYFFIGRNRQCFLKIRPSNEPSSCDYSARYRTISGRCNNLVYPEWGSAGQTLKRLLPNAYEDGASVPRGGRHPSTLPNPR